MRGRRQREIISPRSSYLGRTFMKSRKHWIPVSPGYIAAFQQEGRIELLRHRLPGCHHCLVVERHAERKYSKNMRAAYDNMRKLTTILEQSSTRMCSRRGWRGHVRCLDLPRRCIGYTSCPGGPLGLSAMQALPSLRLAIIMRNEIVAPVRNMFGTLRQ